MLFIPVSSFKQYEFACEISSWGSIQLQNVPVHTLAPVNIPAVVQVIRHTRDFCCRGALTGRDIVSYLGWHTEGSGALGGD